MYLNLIKFYLVLRKSKELDSSLRINYVKYMCTRRQLSR